MKTCCFRGGCLTGPNHSGTALHGFLAYLMRCTATGRPYTVFGYHGKQGARQHPQCRPDQLLSRGLSETSERRGVQHRRWKVQQRIDARGGSHVRADRRRQAEPDYKEANRVGDHVWWISDTSKFSSHYPEWKQQYNVTDILQQIFDNNVDRWKKETGVIDQGKQNLLGVGISAVDYESAVATIISRAKLGQRCSTTALVVHGVITGALDRVHRHRLNTFDLVTPDGQPVRWALNLLHGTKLRDRVYGPKMTLLVSRQAAREGIPVFFYGSKPEVLEHLCTRMKELCPGLQIAGARASQFRRLTADEQMSAVEQIRSSGAKILFVGLGCPRQEVFTYEMSQHLNMPILAVGAAFDYYSGLLDEPPALLQRLGLQWFYRLCQEPRRLWRRYLFTNSQFVGLVIAQWLRLWHPDLRNTDVPAADVRFG